MELPDSLLKQVRELAEKEGVPLEQFIASAMAEKVAAWKTADYLIARASRGDHAKFRPQCALSAADRIVRDQDRALDKTPGNRKHQLADPPLAWTSR